MQLLRASGLQIVLWVAALDSAAAASPPAEAGVHGQRYQRMFQQAADEFSVPAELLESIAYAETRWRPHLPQGQLRRNGEPEIEVEPHGGMPVTYGIMGLRNDPWFGASLAEGAALIGAAPAAAASDSRTNIRAAAALLARLAAGNPRAMPLEGWERAVAHYSGIRQRHISQVYTYEVFAAIREGRAGATFRIRQRDVDMEKIYGSDRLRQLSANHLTAGTDAGGLADYPSAVWTPAASCNYSSRGAPASHVAIHTVQGTYASAISWFQNCAARVSAHYVIRSSDGQVTQMVREADQAWHIGNSNGYTIGIEHEGFVNAPSSWYTGAMYRASASLTGAILAARGASGAVYDGAGGWNAVPPDARFQVKGHVNYAGQSHTDPGAGWDWPRYSQLVAGAAPASPASGENPDEKKADPKVGFSSF